MFKQIGTGIKDNIGKLPRPGKPDEEARLRLEAFEKFEHVHKLDEGEQCLGKKAGMVAAQEDESLQLYVTEKLFAHNKLLPFEKCKDSFQTILRTKDKKEKTVSRGKTSNVNNRVVLYNQEGDVMGAFLQDIHISKQSYQIFGTRPKFPKQHASSKIHQDGKALFCYAIIPTAGKKAKQLTMDVADHTGAFQLEALEMEELSLASGVLGDKVILVYKDKKPAATMKRGAFPNHVTGPAWDINVAPGIDPLLLMGLVAVVDAQSI